VEESDHTEDVDEQQQDTESDSEFYEHLLPPILLELDKSIGDPRSQCKRACDEVCTYGIEQDRVETQKQECL